MKEYLDSDPWSIVESVWHRDYNLNSESIFSIGNGRFGQRANFEEVFTGETHQGNYVGGVYYPDKTRVGWWKNGYPEYFAKVLNAPNWVGINISIDGETFDLNECEVSDFRRELNMKEGWLSRSFWARLKSGKEVEVRAKRFCSIANDQLGAIKYSFKPLNFSDKLELTFDVDADIVNLDSNYDEKFWTSIEELSDKNQALVIAETKKTAFQVCTGIRYQVQHNGRLVDADNFHITKEKYAGVQVVFNVEEGETYDFYKYAAVLSSLNHERSELEQNCVAQLDLAETTGFETLLEAQKNAWASKWEEADIIIEGDDSAQQAIRFNIFQLYQTYTGKDARLNIGPKGFTGEKYGGSTYWDTEAYCLPFYMATAEAEVGRNLLLYRYKHLDRAIENAEKLGFKKGAALYPMVTMNGEECHNEWEITFEEIHRNGAIAYAIYDYTRYTGDKSYIPNYGLEVLVAIARFWAQRVHFSDRKGMYMMHGVTGPNEYENNVNNNWYTNYIAKWCLIYTMECLEDLKSDDPSKYEQFCEKTKFYELTETNFWKDIVAKMYLPEDDKLGIFVQHDGFLDKALIPVEELTDEDIPLNQNWSWDRILRSVYIKQADVLQGMYFFMDDFSSEELKRNFEFYEQFTVHESSLSPCVHSILAAKLENQEKAVEMYLRTARLDLDDYNNDTEDGLHITSMAGTWLSVVKGFGGFEVKNDKAYFSPFLPKTWKSLDFKVKWRDHLLDVKISQSGIQIINISSKDIELNVFGKDYVIKSNDTLLIK